MGVKGRDGAMGARGENNPPANKPFPLPLNFHDPTSPTHPIPSLGVKEMKRKVAARLK